MRRRMSIYAALAVAVLLACLAISLLGIGLGVGGGPGTPQELVERNTGSGQSHILGVWRAPEGFLDCVSLCFFGKPEAAIVLYSTGSSEYVATIAGRYRGRWFEVLSSGSPMDSVGPSTSGLADFSVMRLPPYLRQGSTEVRGDWVFLWGRTLSRKVTFVEATLDTGRTVRAQVRHRLFALLGEAKAACKVRLLDQKGEVLEQIGRSENPTLGRCEPGV